MALIITQDPTTPNLANSNLVFVATSNSSSEAQFQYVVDIKDSSNTLIQRVKQQPNPSAKGVFDLGNLIPSQLGPTDPVWDISNPTVNTNCGKDFKVLFGEEYGTSPSSSLTEVTPAESSSAYYFLMDGFVNESAQLNWNWNSGSKYDEEDATDDVTFSYQNGLTTFDTSSVRLGDYHTISFINGNANGGENATLAQDVFAMTVRQYDSSGVLGSTDIIYNQAGPRTSAPTTTFWGSVYTNQDETTRLIHFPVGPENLVDKGITLDSDLAYYIVEFNSQGTDGFPNSSGVWGEYRFNIDTANCDYPGVRFAYKNQWGVWDYFNFSLAESRTSNIERQEYKQTFVDFSTTSNTVTYNRERRGRTNYYNDVTKIRTANTDFLNQTDADNLREMFFSTDVYVQQSNGEWWPVVLLDTSITEKLNPRSQKLFRYTVSYSYANEQRPRL